MSAPPPLTPALSAEIRESVAPRFRESARSRSPWIQFGAELSLGTKLGFGLAAWTLFLLAWWAVPTFGWANPKLLPPPHEVLEALGRLFSERAFHNDIAISLGRIIGSFMLAALVAIPIGVLMGSFPAVEAFLQPIVSPFRYLPAPSFTPLLLMWLGTGETQKVAFLFIGVIWFLITLIADDTKRTPVELVEAAKTLGSSTFEVLTSVIFRFSLPYYVDTLRQMLAVSWTYLVIAEIVAATDGIGAMMMRAKRVVQVDEIMAGILVIGLLGLFSDALLRVLRWFCFPHLRREN